MKCNYSFKHYLEILQLIKKQGYNSIKVSETVKKQEGKIIVLRHDVDTSPKNALKTAVMEHKEGIISSYYVLLHSKLYNALSPDNIKIIKQIRDLGHEIGLHYDTSVFHKENILSGVINDIKILELAINTTVKSVSQHNPSTSMLVKELGKHVIDSYNDNLINGSYKYFSDSGYQWRHGCICKFLGKFDKLHILIHPNSWSLGGGGYKDVLQNNLKEITRDIKEEIEETIKFTTEYLKKREKLDKIRENCYKK
ncbi:MAG: hypothetical protein ABIC04_07820 [Nanoarchaeota archaeon]